ncbi:MAG: serine hydrolase, partial [Pseudomonadota bacterium]
MRLPALLILLLTALATPSVAGPWSEDGLDALRARAEAAGSTSLVLLTDGEAVLEWGDVATPTPVHSVRKSVLAALIAQNLGDGPGEIPLEATLADLGIDDVPPLAAAQREARVLDLLRSTSGVARPAAAETVGMRRAKSRLLGDGRPPGTTWAYNNWDYNVLTTVLEERTGRSVADLFADGLARPLGLRDVDGGTVFLYAEPDVSPHRKAGFALSARDMATFGELHRRGGRLNGKRLLPRGWTRRIVEDFEYTDEGPWRAGHGLLWWLPLGLEARRAGVPDGAYYASGFAGQAILVVPAWRSVLVLKTDTRGYEPAINALAEREGLDPDAPETLERFIGTIAGADCAPRPARPSSCDETPFVDGGEVSDIFRALAEAWTGRRPKPPKPHVAADADWLPGRISDVDAVRSLIARDSGDPGEAEVYGALGYAFIINVSERLVPWATGVWDTGPMLGLAGNVGLKIDVLSDRLGSTTFDESQKEAWRRARDAIDAGRPAVGFGVLEPSNYLIAGYDADGYYVVGPDAPERVGSAPWRSLGRDSVGVLSLWTTARSTPIDRAAARDAALAFALRHAAPGSDLIFDGYASGPAAYDVWIAALEDAPPAWSRYTAGHWAAMRRLAADYLRSFDDSAELLQAADLYTDVATSLEAAAGSGDPTADLLQAQ